MDLVGVFVSRMPRPARDRHALGSVALALVLVLNFACAAAAEHGVERVRFFHYGTEDGLSQTTARVLLQDRRGFLWIGTQDGLNRFDGYEFRVYRHAADDPASVADNHVTALAQDADGTHWVGTQAGGLSRHDSVHDRFETWRHRPGADSGLAGNPVTALLVDRDGRTWVASGSGYLQWVDARGRFTDVPRAGARALGGIRVLRQRANGDVIVGARQGLWILGRDGTARGELRADPALALDAYDAIETSDGELWVASADSGVHRFDAKGALRGSITRRDGLADDATRAILQDRAGRIWVGTFEGLSRIDGDGSPVRTWRTDLSVRDGLAANRIQALIEDRDGQVWIGTWFNGLDVFNPRTEAFVAIRPQGGDPLSLPGWPVPALHVDRDDTLWFGVMDAGGLVHFDLATGVIRRWTHDPADPDSLSSNAVQDIQRDRRGRLWVGTVGGGVNLLRDDGKFTRFRHDPADPRTLASDTVHRMYVDRANTLWVGTLEAGLSALCDGCSEFRNYQGTDEDSLLDQPVTSLLEDSKGRFWIGQRPGGLARLDRTSGRIERWHGDPANPGALSNDSISALFEDSSDRIWIGTQGGGLNRMDESAGGLLSFQSWSRREGLAGDAIGGIVEDADGALWVSTISGISRLDPASGRVQTFGLRDGVQSRGYFIGSRGRLSDGRIAFGGLLGVTVFDPRVVRATVLVPGTAITNLQAGRGGGRPDGLELQAQNGRLAGARLRRGHDDLVVEFSALSFTDPGAVGYAYRLDGMDPGWIPTDARRRIASYTDLAAGEYQFRVRARLPGGDWGKETQLRVEVPAPAWATRTALTGYAAAALLLAATFGWLVRQRALERTAAERHLRASEARLKTTLWGTGDELWEVDLVTRELRRENPLMHIAAARDSRMADYTALAGAFHPDDLPVFQRALVAHVKGESEHFDVTYRMRDLAGEWRWLRSRGRAMRDAESGRAMKLSGTTSDVTDLKEHEAALERINQDLERRVRDRTADLSVANDSLRRTIEELQQAQQQLVESEKMAALGSLVAGVAHEINTPLGVGVTAASHLEGETQRLMRKIEANTLARSDLEAFQRVASDSAQLILRNLQRADKLVKSFKQVAVDQSSEQRRRIDLRTYLDEILTSLHPAIKRTRHVVEVECPPDLEFETYPGAIYQIVVNLVMNSLIHGFEGMEQGHVRIAAHRRGDELVLEYTDDGRGMIEDVRRRVFEPFCTTRRGQGGSGLGLHICYNLTTQVLRGTIGVESAPGRGVKFVIRFPIEPATRTAGPRHEEFASR